MDKTLFQHRLGNILAGTESLTPEEIAAVNGITSFEMDEEAYEEEIDPEELNGFKFGI